MTRHLRLSNERRSETGLLLLTMIWGTTFITTRTALGGTTPLMLLSMRFVIGFLALFILFFPRLRRITRLDIGAGVLLGAIFFIGNVLQTTGLKYTNAGTSGFITAMSVVMVPPVAAVILREKPRLAALVGIVLATIGLALLSLNDSLSMGFGELLTLGCAVAFAFHIVYVAKYGSATDPVAMVAVQLLVSSLAAFTWVAWTGEFAMPSTGALVAAVYLGLLATAFAFVLQVYAQRHTSATRAAVIFTMEPVFAAFFAYLIAGEMISPRGLIGCGLILVAMLVAELL